jgi:hypothetical protein
LAGKSVTAGSGGLAFTWIGEQLDMKISLLIESGTKTAEKATAEIKDLLTKAGYDVAVTWPDLQPLIKRVATICDEVKKLK